MAAASERHEATLGVERIRTGLGELSHRLGLPQEEVIDRAASALDEMWSSHEPIVSGAWREFGRLLTRRYELKTQPDALARVKALDVDHPLVFLFSHRSYLDVFLLNEALRSAGISPFHALAGANLSFWPLAPVVRRTGGLFIRRDSKDDPIYRFMLRNYLHCLMDERRNLGWAIEGGRTRTGKLRPPRFGALRYVVDAARDGEGPEPYLVPVSVVYDQLSEVASMASEALGAGKRPEDLRWLARFTLMQLDRGGVAHIDIGAPIRLRERIAAHDAHDQTRGTTVERVAVEVCHGINRVTPATPTAVVTVALLGAERALTLAETRASLQAILDYLARHPHLPARLEGLGHDWIRLTLEDLVANAVVECFDGGPEPVYQIARDQHLVAAFYRNTLTHLVLVRAIGELVLYLVRDRPGDLRLQIWHEALRVRELLKFEFFFARRTEFEQELMSEIALLDPEWEGRNVEQPVVTRRILDRWMERSKPHVAQLVLRPFFDAYLVVATALLESPVGVAIDHPALLERSLGLGRQWVLQRKLHSAESVTLELFRNALRLAEHRGLLEPSTDVMERRQAFVDELRYIVEGLRTLAAADRQAAR